MSFLVTQNRRKINVQFVEGNRALASEEFNRRVGARPAESTPLSLESTVCEIFLGGGRQKILVSSSRYSIGLGKFRLGFESY